MRAGCVVALIGCLASLGATIEQEFPYAAYTTHNASAVRSGPGRNFYATDKLPAAEMVVVYKHQDDWCAIRPPEGSFSWVKADDLRISSEGIGIVLAEGAASRIGSRISDLRDVIQVRLERGEEVEVLDAIQVSNDNGVEFYCKIAPPSGEFRWIRKDDLSREKPDASSSESVARESRTGSQSEASENLSDRNQSERSDRWGSWVRSRRRSEGQLDPDPQQNRAPSPSHQTSISLASADDIGKTRHGTGVDAKADDHEHSAAVQAAELEAIDRELSRIVVQEPAQWNLAAVRHQIELAMQGSRSSEVRERIQDLEERISKFEDIHRRSVAIISNPAPSAPPVASRSVHESTNIAPSDPARFDGVGKLTRVVSQRPNAPRFALVNNANEVVSFVSPAPGVNLQSYEGQQVGLFGQRGYMPELKKPHITALRVSPLELDRTRIARRH
jgi:hypothetical protein